MKAPKRLSSGKYIDLNDVTTESIELSDINNSLNYLYRFTGHFKDNEPLTVAQHTKLCMRLARELFPGEKDVEFDCLLHDMPEAYYGDIATPLKRMFGEMYKQYTKQIDDALYEKFWKIEPAFTEEVYHKRKVCDLLALDIERRAMWKSQVGKSLWPEIPNESKYSMDEKFALYKYAKRERFVDLEKTYEKFN